MTAKKGFTLVEMSMVLVIISLVMGAVLVGQGLIRSAQIQKVTGEMQQYIQALKIFQDKYHALPGDFSDAADFFRNATDGNGDGVISGGEEFLAWDHLQRAALVEGSFTAAAGAGGASDRIPGQNVPASKFGGAGWGLVFIYHDSPDISFTGGDTPPGHVLWFGGNSVSGADNRMEPLLTPEDALLIDQKLDDGLPLVGKVLAQINLGGSVPNCYNGSSVYDVSISGNACALVFKTGY